MRRRVSIGRVLSDLARQALARPVQGGERDGVPLLPVQPGSGVVTHEFVRQLEDDLAP